MTNEALLSVTGYVATDPSTGKTTSGIKTLKMRVGWTPRKLDTSTGQWMDEPSSFATVRCYRRLAENAAFSLRKGDPVVVTGKVSIHDYDAKDGSKRTNVDILATSIGHDLSRGVTSFRKGTPRSEESARDQSEATTETGDLEADAPPGPAEQDLADAAGPTGEMLEELDRQAAESDSELETVLA